MKFTDLLNKQKELDEAVAKSIPNGVIPRERTLLDIKLALDDEFQEWLKELPKEYNFKTWKEHEHDRYKEVEELTDVLFFILQLLNYFGNERTNEISAYWYDNFEFFEYFLDENSLMETIKEFKRYLWRIVTESNMNYIINYFVNLAILRGFTKEEITDTYFKKWEKNMKRINGEWSL